MRNKKFLTCVLVLLCITVLVVVLSGCTKKNENMLNNDNGIFKYSSLTELKNDWILKTADSITEDSDVFTMNADEEDDSYSLTINTADSGWAYVGQEVKLTQGQYYKITYSVDISKISAFTSGNNYDGVFVSFLEDENFNYNNDASAGVADESLMQLETGSGEYVVGFKAKSGGNATIVLNVGTKDYPASINVTLKKFTLERVDKSAITATNDAGSYVSDYYGLQSDFNIFYIVMGAIIMIVLCYFAYFAYQRHLHLNTPEHGYTGFFAKLSESKYLGIIMVTAIALILRLISDIVSTAVSSGYLYSIMGYNLESLTTQAMFISKFGPKDLGLYLSEFATDNGLTYGSVSSSPLQVYFLGLCGLLGRIFESGGNAYPATLFFIRFLCSLADIGTVIIIYLLIRKSAGNIGAIIVAGLYAILPVIFATSSIWGYTDSVTVFLIVLTVYFMLKNNYIGTAITYFVACMFSLTALFIAPLIIFYTVMQCIIDIKKVIPASIIFVLAFFVFYALNAPIDINYINDGKVFYCFEKTWAELYSGAVYVRNAFNFQSLLGNNFAAISTASVVVTAIFIVFLLTLIGLAYFKFKNRMNLVLMATAFINMLFVFGNNMNPISMYISLALMLIYAIINKEKRIYFSFVVFAVLMFINVSYSELFIEYTSSAIGTIGKDPVMYVFSAINLIMVLYYIYIVYDIVVSRKVRKILPMQLTYSQWLSNLGRRIKKGYYKTIIKLQRK